MNQRHTQPAYPVKLAEGPYYHIQFYLPSVEFPLILSTHRRKIKWSVSTMIVIHYGNQTVSMFQMAQ
jgi:hypothetical protein